MLGEELRKAREAVGLTQQELALKANVDRSYVSQLEHDKKSPTVDMLFRLCDVMRIRPSTLLARIEQARQSAKSSKRSFEQ